MDNFLVVGVDLAGVPSRPSGMCLLRRCKATTSLLYSDEEIQDYIMKIRPNLIAIDAPLTFPPGRKSIEDKNASHYRLCDLELRRRKIPFFPITLGPMRELTRRGILIRKQLEREGFRVVEIYPGGAQQVWHIPRVKHDRVKLRAGLKKLGIKGLTSKASDHELDAATGALVGLLFLQGKAEVYGDFSTGAIIMPSSLG
jgi:hypothetical protein